MHVYVQDVHTLPHKRQVRATCTLRHNVWITQTSYYGASNSTTSAVKLGLLQIEAPA